MKKFILFLFFLFFTLGLCSVFSCPLHVSASPSVSANVTWGSIKNNTNNYCGSYCSDYDVYFNAADGIAKGVGLLTGLPIDGIDSAVVGSSGVIYDFTYQDLQDAYQNQDVSFFEAHLNVTPDSSGDLYDVLRPLCDDVIANIDNNMFVYTCPSVSHVADFINLELNGQNILDQLLGQFGNDENSLFPIYFYRWRSSWIANSLVDINGNNANVDALVLYSGSWANFINNASFYQSHGYIPDNLSPITFKFYSNGSVVNLPFRHNIRYGSENGNSYLEIFPYYNISGEGSRVQTSLFSLSGDKQIIFFRSQSAYQNWFNNNSDVYVMPFDFSGFDMSDIDFSDLIRVIENNGGLIGNNISELYKHLSLDLEKYFDKLIIIQSNTNELLVNGFRDVVYRLDDIIGIITDFDFSGSGGTFPPDTEIETQFDTILQDSSLSNRIAHIFPFGFFLDCKDLIEEFADVPVLEPRFTFAVDLFGTGVKQQIVIDVTEVPNINTWRSIWFFFLLLVFNVGMLAVEYKFISMFFGGG